MASIAMLVYQRLNLHKSTPPGATPLMPLMPLMPTAEVPWPQMRRSWSKAPRSSGAAEVTSCDPPKIALQLMCGASNSPTVFFPNAVVVRPKGGKSMENPWWSIGCPWWSIGSLWAGIPRRYENAPAESSAHVTHASAVQAPTWKLGWIWVPWVTLRP